MQTSKQILRRPLGCDATHRDCPPAHWYLRWSLRLNDSRCEPALELPLFRSLPACQRDMQSVGLALRFAVPGAASIRKVRFLVVLLSAGLRQDASLCAIRTLSPHCAWPGSDPKSAFDLLDLRLAASPVSPGSRNALCEACREGSASTG